MAIVSNKVLADEAEDLADEEDDEEVPEERQLGAVRDTIKNFMSGTVKYITNTRLIPRVITQAFQRPGDQTASASTNNNVVAPNLLGNIIRTMRSAWVKRNQEGQNELRKRIAQITKRLTNSKVILGTLHKLGGKDGEESKRAEDSENSETPQTPQFIPIPYYV